MNSQNTLCLIVDIQTRLVPAMADNETFVAKCQQFLTGLNALQVPMLITEQYPKGLGSTLEQIRSLTSGCPVVEKTQFSALVSEVALFLAEKQIENVLIIGGETHICVLQTVLDLRAKGLNVYLPQECLASRTATNKANGIMQMQQAGAVVSNIESLLFMLLKDAKHPAFKTISKLIV